MRTIWQGSVCSTLLLSNASGPYLGASRLIPGTGRALHYRMPQVEPVLLGATAPPGP